MASDDSDDGLLALLDADDGLAPERIRAEREFDEGPDEPRKDPLGNTTVQQEADQPRKEPIEKAETYSEYLKAVANLPKNIRGRVSEEYFGKVLTTTTSNDTQGGNLPMSETQWLEDLIE